MNEQQTFEFAKREPIEGFPELKWKGKRHYESTVYFPAQIKESYGTDVDGWRNKIYWGDNLQVMSHLLRDFRGKVDLIYIDPPFDSKADYKKKIKLKGRAAASDLNSFEEKQYGDIWTNDEYLQFMYERLILMRELLSDVGSIYLHCDYHRSHQLRCLLDEVFGIGSIANDKKLPGFRSEIIWDKGFRGTESKGIYQRTHDVVFWYSKTSKWIWNQQLEEYKDQKMSRYNKVDEYGKRYALIKRVRTDGSIYYGKCYFNEAGKKIEDVIFEPIMASTDRERTDYPTQKPEVLIEKFIKSSSNEGSIVFDCFMGSGTTQAVAMRLGRRFLGADINLGAIQTTTKRLISVAADLEKKNGRAGEITLTAAMSEMAAAGDCDELTPEETRYTGFDVYNVNNYDLFRNPVEAKDLILQALEVEQLPAGSVFDGEKDGWMVKVLPVNRIATKADLAELKANLPYKTYEKRREENPNPNAAVGSIWLICMGHEPDLKAAMSQEETAGYKLNVEILDILRDKKDIKLKHEPEAEIVREGGRLVIRSFYPRNLMQKLSLTEDGVDDWRQLVESVMIDWNYDGSVLSPVVIDIPARNEFVAGSYEIPESAGTIKVKITDVLSESLEKEV